MFFTTLLQVLLLIILLPRGPEHDAVVTFATSNMRIQAILREGLPFLACSNLAILTKRVNNAYKKIRRDPPDTPPGEDPDKENPRPKPLPGKKQEGRRYRAANKLRITRCT
jgi:hypothetical protein